MRIFGAEDDPQKVTEITATLAYSFHAEDACPLVGGAKWTEEQSGLGA